jgi:hypothetical protein
MGWRETIARLKGITRASELLLDALNDQREGYNFIWKLLGQISARDGLAPLTHDDVYPIVSRLFAASSAAPKKAELDRRQGAALSHREPWSFLVTELARMWTHAGGSVAAPKSGRAGYAQASPFVQLVWTVMTRAVPKSLRQYTASRGAMQAAISRVLSRERKIRSGPFPKKTSLDKSRHPRP